MQKKIKRILFFHQGRMSDINGSVYRGLSKQFPTAEIVAIDINKLIKARPWIIALNLIIACYVYGWDMICRKRDLDESFFGTKYIFNKISQLAQQVHKQLPADFTFQTGSMFNYSSKRTPHFVYTDHTYLSCKKYPEYGKNFWAPIRRDWTITLEESIYKDATGIFTRSSNVTDSLIKEYLISKNKVLCVKVGTNVPLNKLCKIPITLDRYESKRVVIVGRRWDLKGGPELVQAFKEVVKVHKDARLIIVGCNPQINEKFVEIAGSKPLDEVLNYLAQSSIFCMPTKMEPFGVAFIEALASGLPVVALKLGAAPDFVIAEETGILSEHGDIHGLSKALIELLDNPEKCRQYAENGRTLVQEKYNWDKVFEEIGNKILSVL